MQMLRKTTEKVTQALSHSVSIPKFLQSDDDAIIKKVQETHKPDGRHQVDVNYLFTIIAKILVPENRNVAAVSTGAVTSTKHEIPVNIIKKLCCELACNCSGGNAQETTMLLLQTQLSTYSWDAKLVIVMAAFAVNYSEFHLFTELYTKNPIAKNIAVLKQLQGMLEDASLLEHLAEAIDVLIGAIMDVTLSVFKFNGLPSEYIATNKPSFSTAVTDITRAVYWAIRSVVTCGLHVAALVGLKNEHNIATMAMEISQLASKVSSMQSILEKQFHLCKQEIEGYNLLINIFNTAQDNVAIIQAFFLAEGGKNLPLVIGRTKQEVKYDVLKDANVFLLITSLDHAWDVEIKALAELYQELQTKGKFQYHLIWIPVVGKLDEHKFLSLQSHMPWYTVRHPSVIKPEVIRYIKEVWKFTNQTILVRLEKGRAQGTQTIDLVWMKGHLLCPPQEDRRLWEHQQLTIDHLIHDIYTVDSTKPAPIICLYGGEDIKWIEEFTALITRVKEFTKMNIELVYVSKKNAIDHVNHAIFDFITTKKVGIHWKAEETYSWRFWTRLESIFSLGIKDGKNPKEENIMKDVMTLLSFKDSHKGWAVFGKFGSSLKLVKASGEVIQQILLKINTWWKAGATSDYFLLEFNKHIEQKIKVQQHHCNHLVLPAKVSDVPDEMMICAICDRKMEKYLMYRCCE